MNRLILFSILRVRIWSISFKANEVFFFWRPPDQERHMHLSVRVGLFCAHLPVDFTPSDVFDKFLSSHQYAFLASLHSSEQLHQGLFGALF